MQPLKAFKDLLFTAGSYLTHSEDDTTSESQDLDPTNADTAGNQLTKERNVEEIPRPANTTSTGSKRGREDSASGAARDRKRSQPSIHERRLTGDFDEPVPKDAIDIWVEVKEYDRKNDWNPDNTSNTAQPVMAKPSRNPGQYGPQPRNDLGKRSKQSAPVAPTGGFFRPFQRGGISKSKSPPELETQPSRGGNVLRRQGFPDDGQDASSRKRQKTSHVSSDPVDLTDDANDDQPQFFGTPYERIKGGHVQTQKATRKPLDSLDMSFQRSEQKKVDVNVNIPTTVAKYNRTSGSVKSSQNQFTPEIRKGVGTRQAPVELPDAEVPKSQGLKRRATTVKETHQSNQALPIELDKGFDDLGPNRGMAKAPQGSNGDISKANRLLEQKRQGKSNGVSRNAQQTTGHHQHTNGERAQPLSDTAHHNEGNMRLKFIRDSVSVQNSDVRQRAPERMSMNNSAIDDEDPLNGPPTVGSRTSHNESPERRSNVAGCAVQKLKHPPPSSDHADDTAESTAISIRAIYCKMCVLRQAGLELVWDEELRAHVLFRENQEVWVDDLSGDRLLVKIQVSDANFGYMECRQSLKAVLKGSLTGQHSGRIAIEFDDIDGMTWCFEALWKASGRKLRTDECTVDLMNKIFQKQIDDAILHQGRTEQNARRRSMASTYVPQRVGNHAARNHDDDDDDDEVIKYEDLEVDEKPAKARSRMRADNATMKDVLRDEGYQQSRSRRAPSQITSQYFSEPRKSTRQTKPTQTRQRTPSPPPLSKWTVLYKPQQWPHPVVYPTEGKSRVTVDFADLGRLDEGEWLNDNLVNYELRYIEEHMKPEHKKKVHFFNTFFYSSLSTKGNKKAFNYEAVMRWTKKIDLFTVPYVVVPINNQLHWFVAIICNLPQVERKLPESADDQALDGHADAAIEVGENEVATKNSDRQGSEQDAADRLAEEIPDDASKEPEDSNIFAYNEDGTITSSGQRPDSHGGNKQSKKRGKKAPNLQKYDPKGPSIITLDSLGSPHSTDLKYLKQYLSAEASSRREIELGPQEIQGVTVKGLPLQQNFCDCGLFLGGYVAKFAEDPEAFVRKALQREINAENFDGFDASDKRTEIRNRLLKLQKEQEEKRRASKKAKASVKNEKAPSQPTAITASNSEATAQEPPMSSTTRVLSTPTPRFPKSEQEGLPLSKDPATCRASSQVAPSNTLSREQEDDEELEIEAPKTLSEAPASSPPLGYNQDPNEDREDGSDSEDDDSDSIDNAPTSPVNSGLPPNPYTAQADEPNGPSQSTETLLDALESYTNTG